MFWQILAVFLVSMVPIVELRGAIPFAVWAGFDLPTWAVFITAIIGNMVPVPFIYLFARKVLNWGSQLEKPQFFKKFCNFCLQKGEKAGNKLLKNTHGGVYLALLLFVAIPVPGTGAWTGTLAASILDLDFKKTVFAIIMGILVAACIILFGSIGLSQLFAS